MATTFYSMHNSDVYANTSYSGADMIASINIPSSDGVTGGQFVIGDLQTLSYSLHMERGAVRALGNINVKDYTNGPRTIGGSLVFAVFDKHILYKFKEVLNKTGDYLADELPPFDITISFASEYGHRSVLRIYGVRLVNEGEVMSVNDIYTENTYMYVARNLEYLKSLSDLFEDDTADKDTADSKTDTQNHTVADSKTKPSLILLSVTPQSNTDNGIANFTIKNAIDTDYTLLIRNMLTAQTFSYCINTNSLPLAVALPVGSYYAFLTTFGLKDDILDQLTFEVKLIANTESLKGLYIDNAFCNTITGERINTSLQEICYTLNNETKSVKINELGYFEITDVTSNMPYVLYGKTQKNDVTPTSAIKTDLDYETTFRRFKQYVMANHENILNGYYTYFAALYDNALSIFKNSNYTYSLTKCFYQAASSPAAQYFTFLANRYEMNLMLSTRTLHIYLYKLYTHDFLIEKNLKSIAVYTQDCKKIKTINSANLSTLHEFYLYTLTQKTGIYTLIFYFKDETESHLEYYVLPDKLMNTLITNIKNQTVLFEDELDSYYWSYKNAIKNSDANETEIYMKLFVLNHKAFMHGVICMLTAASYTNASFSLDTTFCYNTPAYLVFMQTATEQLISPAIKIPVTSSVCTFAYADYGLIPGQYYYYYVEDAGGRVLSDINLFTTLTDNFLTKTYRTLYLEDYAKPYASDYKDYFESALVNECRTIHEVFESSFQEICSLKDSKAKDTLLTLHFKYYWDYLFINPLTFSSELHCSFIKTSATQITFTLKTKIKLYDQFFLLCYDAVGTLIDSKTYTAQSITFNCNFSKVQYVVYYYCINKQYSKCQVYNLLRNVFYK